MRSNVRKTADWTTQAEGILECLLDAGKHHASAIGHLLNDVSEGSITGDRTSADDAKTPHEYGLLITNR